ncbi:helix-turn-helix domain-containing protein, partial [Escherichia coli]|nr:helix-turn-helix domain-containing protein [Escherichia coli]
MLRATKVRLYPTPE